LKRKVYISGPMTGIEQLNRPAFEEAEIIIESEGDIPINPFKLTDNIRFPFGADDRQIYFEFMKIDIRGLMDCDAIYLLPGWNHSKGACMELVTAHFFGLKIIRSGSDSAERLDSFMMAAQELIKHSNRIEAEGEKVPV